ncbi:MAG: Csu type fimbrial protein [Nostoc sp.]
MMLRRFALASVLLIASSAAPAMAGTASTPLGVTATVTANCLISTAPVAFGSYDPVFANASSPLTGTGTVTTTCTDGSAATITLGQGTNAFTGSTDALPLRQVTDGATPTAHFLSYSLYQDTTGTVWGNTSGTGVAVTGSGLPQDNTIHGSIGANQNQPAGLYSDSVLATVSF